jgi:hypothetical protein
VLDRGSLHVLSVGQCADAQIVRRWIRSLTFEENTVHFNLSDANEAAQYEREIGALNARTGIALAEVRALYAQEFARLARGATVRSYLALRTTSNVLEMMRRRRNAQ